jgi:probable DNA metabolism protein
MIYFLYDGTFEGLLTALGHALEYDPGAVDIVREERFVPDLFADPRVCPADRAEAARMIRSLKKTLTRLQFLDIYYCSLSEERGIETTILEYVRLILGSRGRIVRNMANDWVRRVSQVSLAVTHEINRFHGFVRFRLLRGGLYYAAIEPDNNIVPLLAPHFVARFADQNWFIHDLRRNVGIYYDLKRCTFISQVELIPELVAISQSPGPGKEEILDDGELLQQQLWKEYFQKIAIQERANPQLQRQHLPRRYWRHLIEEMG